MPADYSSTARALSLPVSPDSSSTPTFQSLRPPWKQNSRRSNSSSGARSPSPFASGPITFRDSVINGAEKIQRRIYKTVKKMNRLQRVLAGIGLVTLVGLGILFLVFNEKIFGWLQPYAVRWKKMTGGWLILWAITWVAAFPPLIGFSTCGTIAGFVYGFPEGWFIFASATVVGSLCSFLVSRTILSKYVHRLVSNDTRFAALTLTLKSDGLKLLVMIRLCPLPYSFSNGAISTIPTVHPVMFAVATAIVTPKLMIHVFIGSRLAAIAKSGGEMSAGTRAINWISIIGGAVIGTFTGWYIYKKTMDRARQLEAEERAKVRQSASHLPSPGEFADDSEEATAATTLRDDEVDYFADETRVDGYRDEFTDDDDEVFEDGDGDEEAAIGLHRKRSN